MAGVDAAPEGGRRRALDSQINMIPMIDLLMVTVSFLLITAVWSTMGRMEASANVPHELPDSDWRPVWAWNWPTIPSWPSCGPTN